MSIVGEGGSFIDPNGSDGLSGITPIGTNGMDGGSFIDPNGGHS
jgi:hypothetical protein